MPVITFTRRDLLRGKIVTPAWYRLKIESVGESPTKDGKSTNYPIEGVILFNGDDGTTEFKDVPIDGMQWFFTKKLMSQAIGLFNSLGIPIEEDSRFELKALEGQEVDAFVENNLYEGRLSNRINHKYRAIRSEVKAVE